MNQQQIKVSDLVKQRAVAFDAFKALADKAELTDAEKTDYDTKKRAVEEFDGRINRAKEAQRLAGESAQPVEGQDPLAPMITAEDDPYSNDDVAKRRGLGTSRGLRAVAAWRLFGQYNGDLERSRVAASIQFGERHSIARAFEPRRDPKTRALVTSVGASGGFIVPPDYMNEIIELLRPKAVVRASGPRVIPMPRGTMTLPGAGIRGHRQLRRGSAVQITSSQQTVEQIVASFKKLTALVPVSQRHDALRRSGRRRLRARRPGQGDRAARGPCLHPGRRHPGDPAGLHWPSPTAGSRRKAGTAGIWLSTANSTAAVNGADRRQLHHLERDLHAGHGGGRTRRPGQQARHRQRAGRQARAGSCIRAPTTTCTTCRTRSASMCTATNSSKGTLLSYPVKKTTQIPINIYDTSGTQHGLLVHVPGRDERGHDPGLHEPGARGVARGHLRRRRRQHGRPSRTTRR